MSDERKTLEQRAQMTDLAWSAVRRRPASGERYVSSHDWDVLGVQLRGHYDTGDSTRTPCFDWFPGQYVLHLYGRINNRRRVRLSPCSGFAFEL